MDLWVGQRVNEMSEQDALRYQVEHLQSTLIEFSENFGIDVQVMLMLMGVYR